MNPRSSLTECKSATFTRVLRVLLGALHVITSPSYSSFSCWWKTVDKTWIHHSRWSASAFRRSMCFLFWRSICITVPRAQNPTGKAWLVIGWDYRCSFRLKPYSALGEKDFLGITQRYETPLTSVFSTTELSAHPQLEKNLTPILYC